MFKDLCPGGACRLGSKGTRENHAHPTKTIFQWLTGFQDSGIMFKDLCLREACRLGSKRSRENHAHPSKAIFQWLTGFQDSRIMFKDLCRGGTCWLSSKGTKRKPRGSIKEHFSVTDRVLRLLYLRRQLALLVVFVLKIDNGVVMTWTNVLLLCPFQSHLFPKTS